MHVASETGDRRLQCDNDFILTSALFHTDHTNLRIRMVPITTGESSEILWSRLVGSRDIVNKRMRKGHLRGVWYHMLGNVAKGATFLIHLWRNILKTFLGIITETH